MPRLERAPDAAPASLRTSLVAAAAAWYDDPLRPRFSEDVCARWCTLLEDWIATSDMPLIVRKARNNRGHVLRHTSGREYIPADNSPAHWSVALAFAGVCPTLLEVREQLAQNRLPFAMVLKADERRGATYTCTRQAVDGPNALGWKVAHIDDVGLGYAGAVDAVPLGLLHDHMRRFLSPQNIFVVPMAYAGVAETPEFIEEFRRRAQRA